jgi:hypothetical protein
LSFTIWHAGRGRTSRKLIFRNGIGHSSLVHLDYVFRWAVDRIS